MVQVGQTVLDCYIEGNVDFPVKGVVAGKGSQVHGISDEWRWLRSHKGGGHQGPSIRDSIQAMMTGMNIVAMVNIVMVEPNVMRVALCPVFQSEFITVLDMIFELMVVHDEPFGFISHMLFVLAVG